MRTPQRHQARDSGFLARQARVKRGTLASAARADDRLGRRSAAGTPSAPGCCGSARLPSPSSGGSRGARQRGALPGQVAGQRPSPVRHCRDLIGGYRPAPGRGAPGPPATPLPPGHPTPQEQSPRPAARARPPGRALQASHAGSVPPRPPAAPLFLRAPERSSHAGGQHPRAAVPESGLPQRALAPGIADTGQQHRQEREHLNHGGRVLPPSLFEHPAAELSVDDSAQLGEGRRQPDHIA